MGESRSGRGLRSDPLFVAKLKAGFADCQASLQASLDRSSDPLQKLFGRLMIFFRCAAETEVSLCTKYEARAWLDRLYGRLDMAAALFA